MLLRIERAGGGGAPATGRVDVGELYATDASLRTIAVPPPAVRARRARRRQCRAPWSPDGTRIAFDRQDDGYNWIYVANADGSGVRRLTANFNWHPDWTPDGRISFIGDGGIWLINANGSGKRLLAQAPIEITGREASVMSWSPDGAQVALSPEHQSG